MLGHFRITKLGKGDHGRAMLRDAIAIYHEMGVPDEAVAQAIDFLVEWSQYMGMSGKGF